MSLSLFLLAIPLLALGAVLALVSRSNRASAAVALATQAGAIGLVLAGAGRCLLGGGVLESVWPWPPPINAIAFRVDGLGAFFLAWSLPLTWLGTLYAIGYLRPYFAQGRHGGSHFALLNLIALSFVLVYSVQNALVFLLGWEIAAVAAWLLVIWDYRSQKIRFAGFNYLVSTHVGLFVLVAAFMLLHSKTGSMDFAAFAAFLARPSPTRGTVFLLLGAAFALKSAFFPFHSWLPRAHAAAPAHVSALMSGVIHKAGLFGFLRFTLLMGRPEEWMGWTVLAFGAVSAFSGVLYTSTQRDLKRLLGYSSTENVGIAAMGFGLGYLGWCWGNASLALIGFAAGLLHVFHHAIFKCLSFYAAGAVYQAAHTVDLERLGGLARRLPRTAALFLLGSLAGSALPPLNGLVSEFILYTGLLSGQAPAPEGNVVLVIGAAALAFVGGVSALSTARAFGVAFLGNQRDASLQVGAEAPASMLVPMLCHALLVVVGGLFPQLAIGLGRGSLALFPFALEGNLDASLAPVGALATASRLLAAALLVLGFVSWWKGRAARRSVTWGCGYTAATARMQYTGSSFSEQLARIFEPYMPVSRRERLPAELFPHSPGQIATHHADAVERRIYEVVARGEDAIVNFSARIPAHSRFAFAAGLFALIVLGALASGGWL
jgi:hydrogenase-4 component B